MDIIVKVFWLISHAIHVTMHESDATVISTKRNSDNTSKVHTSSPSIIEETGIPSSETLRQSVERFIIFYSELVRLNAEYIVEKARKIGLREGHELRVVWIQRTLYGGKLLGSMKVSIVIAIMSFQVKLTEFIMGELHLVLKYVQK